MLLWLWLGLLLLSLAYGSGFSLGGSNVSFCVEGVLFEVLIVLLFNPLVGRPNVTLLRVPFGLVSMVVFWAAKAKIKQNEEK